MTTEAFLNDPYTISFATNAVTFTWGSGNYGPVTFEANDIDYINHPNDVTLTTVRSCCSGDATTVRSTVATNTGGFATAALLQAYITANIITMGTVTSITGGTGITVTPTPLVTTGTITHANFGTAGTYTSPSSITVNSTGHATSITSGLPQLMFRAMLVNPSTFAPTASPEVFPFSNYQNPSGYFDKTTERFTPPANGYYLSCINYQLLDMSFPLTDPGSGFSNKFSVYVRQVGTTAPLQIITSYPKVTQLCGSNTSILSLFSIYQYEMVFRYYTWNEVDQNPTGLYVFSSKQGFSNAENGTSWAIMKLN